ncbi:hypothetical protein ACKWTF_000533 [Chironomus riparius]
MKMFSKAPSAPNGNHVAKFPNEQKQNIKHKFKQVETKSSKMSNIHKICQTHNKATNIYEARDNFIDIIKDLSAYNFICHHFPNLELFPINFKAHHTGTERDN